MQMLERMFQVEMAFMQSESKDVRLLADAFHPDVVVHEPTSLPYSGDWIGLEGIAGLMQQMNRAFSKVAVEDLSCAGSPAKLYVSSTLHLTARASGISITQPFSQILRFENGLLIEGTPFYFDTAEIDAILNHPT
ncbi:nuclear transport factor 2 family protein [Halomonas sp. DX6]|uniref:Nuclear transport factor 2 family protein n=2 Tax=Billgrantia bachuensis TaxID=2717286 RepID=A0ABX0PVT3_9GAMM|nr:nuclear transport factor 2 family protein [Halomonas bachuensis]